MLISKIDLGQECEFEDCHLEATHLLAADVAGTMMFPVCEFCHELAYERERSVFIEGESDAL